MRIGIEHPSGGNHEGNGSFTGIELSNGDEAAAATVAASSMSDRNAAKLPDGNGVETSCRKSLEPHDSMEFESKEDAFEFYKEYGNSVGFSAIIKASRRSRISGKFIDAKFVCSRYGSKRDTCSSENNLELKDVASSIPGKKKRGRINRSWSKTDCKACMHVKRREDGKWTINCFIKDHNHDLVAHQAGVRNTKRCQHNHHEITCLSSRGSGLGFRDGDAQVMPEYFSRMQDENPYFFYAIDLNSEHHLRNVFWVNAKGRIDYSNFGDAVLFNTTCKKNEFKLPFVPFIGMNNHLQFILLGCAFVADVSKSTYAWVMRAWLRSMCGQAPKVILTDQDPELTEAVAEVFPNSRHCFCLCDILSNIQEKLGYVIMQHEDFINKFHKCVLKPQTVAQFEKRWWKLVNRFDLRSDKWIQSLYDDRVRWVPTFMKDIFFAGLSSTLRLESVASHLGKCLPRKTNLKDFLHQYNIMLQEKYEDEAKADYDTWHRQPGLKSPSPYEKQMATIYTNAVFKKFQVEVLGVVACHPKIESKNGATTTFKVQDFESNQVYEVTWDEKTSDTSCECCLFEYNGFVCRHVMIVLQISGVKSIPQKYILKRWTKDAKNIEATEQADCIESKNQRYYDICRRACNLVDEGSLCQETYNIVFTSLEETLRKCEGINNSVQTLSPSNDGFSEFGEVNRGKNKKVAVVSGKGKEHEATTTGDHCWEQMGYLNFRVDCSYGSQESMPVMEQLNTIVPGHDDDCYRNQAQGPSVQIPGTIELNPTASS